MSILDDCRAALKAHGGIPPEDEIGRYTGCSLAILFQAHPISFTSFLMSVPMCRQ